MPLRRPSSAESPFAHPRCYLLWYDVSHHIRRHYPSFIAHTGSWARPNPPIVFGRPYYNRSLSRRAGLPVPAGRWPFPTLSLQSLYRCLDPYPAVFLRCTCSFLPEEHRPHTRSETLGTSGLSLQCNFYKARYFGAAVIPLCSGSHTC